MSRISYKATSKEKFVYFLQEAANKKWGYLVLSGRSDFNYDVFEGISDFYQIEMDSSLAKQITELPPEIGRLQHLKGLTIVGDFDIESLPKEIGELKSLEILDLESNHLRALPAEIGKLKNLRELNLLDNKLSSLPPEFGSLVSLEILDLSYNTEISELPAEFKNLTNLRQLIISDNYFDENHLNIFLRTIPNFVKLKTLALINIGVTSIPSQFSSLIELEDLDLHYNNISDLPDVLAQLKSLRNIDLNGNNFSEIPDCLYELRNLESLYMSENHIRRIDSRISNLERLRILSFGTSGKGLMIETSDFDASNQISELPRSIIRLTNLELLDLIGNPLQIPPEILQKIYEPRAILTAYFGDNLIELSKKEIEDWLALFENRQRRPLLEVKIVFVGQGSVGKTSLVQQILHGKFDSNQIKTEGISINQWSVGGEQLAVGSKTHQLSTDDHQPIKLNIWDFGGQEIMHATHQFFLTKRSLYLLVLDARLTQEENRVEYWLKIIQSFGGESPVLIVGNKTDQHPLDIDRTGLGKKYPNIVGILETSAATGAGIEALKAEIAKQVDTLPHVRDLLPETWFNVKSKLEELARNKNFFTQDEYLGLCATNDVTNETSQHTLIGFLHDLGVVLHFQDDPRLEALGILKPQWVTNGVYKILNSHELFQNQGTLTLPMLNKILNLPEYPSNKRLFIVDMMKKFELCYDIEPDKSFLIPDLLPKDEPFTGEWDDALAFQYDYNVLPSSIISRFIVRMNAFVHKTVWRSGVVLKRGDNTALVKADTEDRKIYIWVKGKEDARRDLLAIIRGEFDAIHKTIAKLEVTEKVPLPNAPEAAPVDLAFLQRLASEGRESLPIQAGNRIIDLLVREVLNQIENEGKSSLPYTTITIHGNKEGSVGNKNSIATHENTFDSIYNTIDASARDRIDKQNLISEVNKIKIEVEKGDQVNEAFLSRRLRNLKKMAPDIADVAFSALTGPGAAISTIVKKVAKKIKGE